MKKLAPFLLFALLATLPAARLRAAEASTSTNHAILSFVDAVIDSVSRNDTAKFVTQFDPDAVILDDAPPFVWLGKGSALRWLAAIHDGIAVYGYERKAPDVIELGPDNRAYVTVPIHFSATQIQGMKKTHLDLDGTWLLVLQQQPAGWRVVGAAWSTRTADQTELK